jgi:hypothetical protein
VQPFLSLSREESHGMGKRRALGLGEADIN